MYKVKLETGQTINFEQQPTQQDIDEVVSSMNIKPPVQDKSSDYYNTFGGTVENLQKSANAIIEPIQRLGTSISNVGKMYMNPSQETGLEGTDLISSGLGVMGGAMAAPAGFIGRATLGDAPTRAIGETLGTIFSLPGKAVGLGVSQLPGGNTEQAQYIAQTMGDLGSAVYGPKIGGKVKETVSPILKQKFDQAYGKIRPSDEVLQNQAKTYLEETFSQWKNSIKQIEKAEIKDHDVSKIVIDEGVLPEPVKYADDVIRWDVSKPVEAQYNAIKNTADTLNSKLSKVQDTFSLEKAKEIIQKEISTNEKIKSAGNVSNYSKFIDDFFADIKLSYGDIVNGVTLNNIKKGLYDRSNTWNKERNLGSKDLNAYDIGALKLKDLIEEIGRKNNIPDVSTLNNKMSGHYSAIKALNSIQNNVVKGGKMSSFFAKLSGQAAGGIAGYTFGGAIGAIVGGGLGGELASAATSYAKMNTGLARPGIKKSVQKNIKPYNDLMKSQTVPPSTPNATANNISLDVMDSGIAQKGKLASEVDYILGKTTENAYKNLFGEEKVVKKIPEEIKNTPQLAKLYEQSELYKTAEEFISAFKKLKFSEKEKKEIYRLVAKENNIKAWKDVSLEKRVEMVDNYLTKLFNKSL